MSTKQKTAIFLTTTDDNGYGPRDQTLRFEVTVCNDDQDAPWRNCHHQYEHIRALFWQFQAFESYSQGRIEYEGTVELETAKQAVKQLTAIDRTLAKIRATEGYADTAGAYVNRVARALGAGAMIVKASSEYHANTGWAYECIALGNIPYHVNQIIAAWRTRYPLPQQTAA